MPQSFEGQEYCESTTIGVLGRVARTKVLPWISPYVEGQKFILPWIAPSLEDQRNLIPAGGGAIYGASMKLHSCRVRRHLWSLRETSMQPRFEPFLEGRRNFILLWIVPSLKVQESLD